MEDSKYIRSVKVFPATRIGLLYIFKRASKDINGGKWDFTGGEINDGESPIQAGLRETYEETGLYIAKDHLIEVPGNPRVNKSRTFDHFHERSYLVGYLLAPFVEINLSNEHQDHMLVNPQQLLNGDVVDGDGAKVEIEHDVHHMALQDAVDYDMFRLSA